MKNLKPSSSKLRSNRWHFCRSALVVAIASLGSMAEADDLGSALNFYSKPKAVSAASLTGGALQGELVAATSDSARPSSVAKAAPAVTAPVADAKPVAKAAPVASLTGADGATMSTV